MKNLSNNQQDFSGMAGNVLSGLSGGTGGVDNLIAANDYEANKTYDNRMAGLRAQGYRGGTANNLFQQGQFTNDFTAQQSGANARLRYDDQQQNFQNKTNLGQLYGNLGNLDKTSNMSLLDMLSGSKSNGRNAGTQSGDDGGASQLALLGTLAAAAAVAW